MASLLIDRVTENRFTFSLDGGTTISDSNPKLFTNGDFCDFKTSNGSNIVSKQRIRFSDVTVRDTFGGTGDFTFTTVSSLWLKLVELQFFDGVSSGLGGGSGASSFNSLSDTFQYFGNNGKVPVVNESQSKLEPKTFYNISKFTELTDVEISALTRGKIVGVDLVNGQLKFVLTNLPSSNTTDILSAVGFADYDNTLTAINYNTPNVAVQLTNNALGLNTRLDQMPFGVTQLWDTSTNKLDFSELSVGDQVFIRFDIDFTTTIANQTAKVFIVFNEGLPDEFTIQMPNDKLYKNAQLNKLSGLVNFYIGSQTVINNQHSVYIESDANGTILVHGWLITIVRKSINIVDFRVNADDILLTPTIGGIGATVDLGKNYDKVILFLDSVYLPKSNYTKLGSIITITTDLGASTQRNLDGVGYFIEGVQADKSEIVSTTDVNGVTTLNQFDSVKATISKVGQTGEFADLKNNPGSVVLTFTTTATDKDSLAVWLNTQNPPIEITANQIPEWELTDGTRYRFENKGKGVYGVGQTPIVEGDFKLVLDGANTKKLETITTPGIYPLWNVVLENVQRIVNGQESGFVTSVNEVLSLSGVSVVKKDMPIVYGFDLINGAGTIVFSVAELNAFPHSDGATVVLSFGGSSYLYVSVSAQWILIGIFTAISNTFAEIELEAEYATVPKVTSSDYGMMVVNLDKVISTTNGELSDADNVQIDLMRSFINFPTSVIAVKNKVVLTDDLVFSKKKMNDLFVKVVANDVNHFDFNFDYRYKNISGTVILKERRTLMLNELALLKANQTGGLVLTAILGNLEGTIEGVTGEGDKFKEPLQTAFDNTTNENMVVNAILQRDDISQVTVTVIANDLTDRTSFATVTGEKVIISDIEAIHTGKLHQWFNFGHEFVMPFESEFFDTFPDIGRELQGNEISSYTKRNSGHMSLSAVVGKEIQPTEDIDADVLHVTGHGANDPIRIDWTDGDKTFRPNLIIVGAGLETDLDANWQTSFGFGMEFIEPTSVSTVPTIPLGGSEPDVHQQSPATAIVAGKLRAIKKSVPNATWQEVRLAARATASRATAWDMYRGFGVIDTTAAIAQLKLDVERNSLVKANIYNRNNKVAKSIDYSKINEDVAVPKRHLASLGLVVADEIVNKAVSFMKDDGGFRDLKADIPGFYKTKFLKQSIKRLHENEEFDGITGIFLPEASRTSNGTSGKLYNLLNPAISFGFTRNSLKYGHRESLKIVEFTAHEPAICYLNGYPELIVEPQRTNLVLNSEPTANEGAASAGVTYQTFPNPFGFASWVNVPFSSSVFGFRYNGNVTDANFYEQHYYIKVPKGMAIDFSNDASVLDSYLSVALRGNINANKTAKFKLKKITNELYFLSAIDFPRGSTNNTNNGIALPNTTTHQRNAIYTGVGLVQTNDTAFTGSYIRTTGATKTVNEDVYTISNLLANGLISATEGTIIERGSNQEVRTVWTGGNKLKFIDNALISTVAEVPNNNAFTLDTSSYRLSEILIYNTAILP